MPRAGDLMYLRNQYQVTKHSEVVTGKNKLGNPIVERVSTPVNVAGYYSPSSNEPVVSGHNRLVVDYILIAPSGVFKPDDEVTIPGFSENFRVEGYPSNWDHSPFGFNPGYEMINLTHST